MVNMVKDFQSEIRTIFINCRYDPLNKFMLLKQCEWPSSTVINDVFEMVITPELEYPIVCVGVTKALFGGNHLKLELLNTNSGDYCL